MNDCPHCECRRPEDPAGTGLREAAYTVNRLNEYASREVPGAVDVFGAAKATAWLSVNSVTNEGVQRICERLDGGAAVSGAVGEGLRAGQPD